MSYIVKDPMTWIGKPFVGNGECVALVKLAAGMPATSMWKRGAYVLGTSVPAGTAIATFGVDDKYENDPVTSHAAIYLGRDIHGIQVVDQWNIYSSGAVVGHQIPHIRTIRVLNNTGKVVNRAEAYYVVE